MKANGSVFRNRSLNQLLSTATVFAIVLAGAPGPAFAQARGTPEGIKVHGHWTLTIRNADGTVATRREFENALETGAGPYLATILARGATFGRWAVFIGPLSGGGLASARPGIQTALSQNPVCLAERSLMFRQH